MPSFRRRHRPDPAVQVPTEGAAPTTEEILLDLRDPLPPGPLEWGMPTKCPRCESWGYVDRIDLVDRVMQLHCHTCFFHWEISEDQIEAANRLRAQAEATADQ